MVLDRISLRDTHGSHRIRRPGFCFDGGGVRRNLNEVGHYQRPHRRRQKPPRAIARPITMLRTRQAHRVPRQIRRGERRGGVAMAAAERLERLLALPILTLGWSRQGCGL